MNKNDLTVDTALVEFLENKYRLTLDMLSMSDTDRARIDGAHEVIAMLRRMSESK